LFQGTTTSREDLPAQRLRAEVPAAALEPALLPGPRMPAAGSSLAGGAAAGQTPLGCRGQSSARRGSTCAPPARQSRVPNTEEFRSCGGAWSRSRNFFSTPLCARPGCHEPPANSIRNPARYCCAACRQAVRNVLDRERKWRCRGTLIGRRKRAYEYQAARAQRCRRQRDASGAAPARPPPQ